MESLHVRRWEKRNRTKFLQVLCISSTEFATENYVWRLDIVQKSLWISSHFGVENYKRRLDIVQSSEKKLVNIKSIYKWQLNIGLLKTLNKSLLHKSNKHH